MPKTYKYCPRCDASLKLDAFGRNRSRSDGLQPICKQCAAKEQRAMRAKRTKPCTR